MELTKDLIGKRVLISTLKKGIQYFESPIEYKINAFSLSGKYVEMSLMDGLGKRSNTWFVVSAIEVVDVLN